MIDRRPPGSLATALDAGQDTASRNLGLCDQGHHMQFFCRKVLDLEFGKLAVPLTLPAPPGKSLVQAPRGEPVPLSRAKLLLNCDRVHFRGCSAQARSL